MQAGLLITFEGGEGVGKSTQIELLGRRLCEYGVPTQLTREPGAGNVGEKLRNILLNDSLAPKAELLLYLADRAQHAYNELAPWLTRRQAVLCDRFIDSSEVYQGFARGLGVARIRDLHKWILPDIWPDLTILLDMPAQSGLKRVNSRSGGTTDRLESENLKFHEALRQGFLEQAGREPERIRVIDALGEPEDVSLRIWRQVKPVLDKWRQEA